VGSGPQQDFLEQLTCTLGIQAQVRFIRWIDRADVLELFRSASVFLFPSHEGAGMVVPEALSFGVPVIALDNVGPGQFLTPDSGIVVAQGTYDDTVAGLGEALKSMQHDKSRFEDMRAAAREHFVNQFHWDRRGERLRDLYAQL